MKSGIKRTAETLLELSNAELLSTQLQFSELVWRCEGDSWNEAQKKAAEILKKGEGFEYIEEFRRLIGVYPNPSIPEVVPIQNTSYNHTPTLNLPVKPDSAKRRNFQLLDLLVPELAEHLRRTTKDNFGCFCVRNIYGWVVIDLLDKRQQEDYLSIEFQLDQKEPAKILIRYSQDKQSVKPLRYEDQNGTFDVYPDIYNRDLVNLPQQEQQDVFLESFLNRMIEQNFQFKWSDDRSEISGVQSVKDSQNNSEQQTQLLAHLESRINSQEQELETQQRDNAFLREKIEEMVLDEIFLHFRNNYNLLVLLLGKYVNELKWYSVTLRLESVHQKKVFFLQFVKFAEPSIEAMFYEENMEDKNLLFEFEMTPSELLIFRHNEKASYGLPPDIVISSTKRQVSFALRANRGASNFMRDLVRYGYTPSFVERIELEPIEVKKLLNLEQEAELIETPEFVYPEEYANMQEQPTENQAEDVAVTVLSVLSLISLGIIGVNLSK